MRKEKKLLTLDYLLTTIEARSTDFNVLVDSFQAGKLDALYTELRDYAVQELLMLPIRRMMKGLPLTDDAETANGVVGTIAQMLADMSGKQTAEVHTDMMEAVHRFPADDIRQASTLKMANRLN